uniref:Uncharacterized protein n=1 Tax=Medicago truncatula TaxID=3880 RepID=I3SUI3_MEDTR|nr:unknown [Medicago truncatula]
MSTTAHIISSTIATWFCIFSHTTLKSKGAVRFAIAKQHTPEIRRPSISTGYSSTDLSVILTVEYV